MDDKVEVRRVTKGGLSYEILTPPNKLKQKVGDGGFDPAAVKQAHRAVQAMIGDFVGQAQAHVAALKQALDQALADAGRQAASIQRIYDKTHELRGEGGTFGFPLITSIGALLCGYIDRAGSPDATELDVVSAHIDAMNGIIATRTTGIDNVTCRQILAELGTLIEQRERTRASGRGEARQNYTGGERRHSLKM